MQSRQATFRQNRASSEVEEILHSRSRRRISGQLGRTHFKLAPGLIQSDDHTHQKASSSRFSDDLNDEYQDNWNSHERSRDSHRSYDDERWKRYTNSNDRRLVRSSSFSSELTSPSMSIAKSTNSGVAKLETFQEVPREAIHPIMSRLPLDAGEWEDEAAADPTKAGDVDYINADQGYNGIYPDFKYNRLVTYTRARLPVIDEESYHLWQSLHALRGISDDYADGYEAQPKRRGLKSSTFDHQKTNSNTVLPPHPIDDSMDIDDCPAFTFPTSSASDRALALVKRLFNWSELPSLPIEDEYVWYGVAFRSKRKIGSESMNLYEADRRSHEEAVNSGGLLMYWYGTPNLTTGHNLATCIWTNRQDAILASSLPLHARAASHSLKAYESFELNRYAIRKVKGETRLRLEEWTEQV